jgi:hypothetical protein
MNAVNIANLKVPRFSNSVHAQIVANKQIIVARMRSTIHAPVIPRAAIKNTNNTFAMI